MTSYIRKKEVEETVWVADDGTEFPGDMNACLEYESEVHVETKVKNVYMYLNRTLNGCGVYSVQTYKDFTSLVAVLGLSRTNMDVASSDVSFKSVTAQFNRFPIMVVHNPVENKFSIQTVEKFKKQYDIDTLCETIEILQTIMKPATEGEKPGEEEKPPVTPGEDDKKDPTEGDVNEGGNQGGENPGGTTGTGEDNKGTEGTVEEPKNPSEGDGTSTGESTDPTTQEGDGTDPTNPSGNEDAGTEDPKGTGGSDTPNETDTPEVTGSGEDSTEVTDPVEGNPDDVTPTE